MTDDYDLAHLRGEVGDLVAPPLPDTPPEPQGLARYSAVYMTISTVLNPPPKKSPYQHYQNVLINGRIISMHTNEYPYGSELTWPVNAYGWKHNVQSHDDAAQLLQSLGAKMLIVLIPTKEEAYGDYLTKTLGQDYLDKMAETRRLTMQQCTDRGWYCLDTLSAFQDAIRKGQTIYYAYDSHLDASGNRLLEDLVHNYIIQNNLLPGRQ